VAALIRVDAVWLATEPIDMRAGMETALARVVKVFGSQRHLLKTSQHIYIESLHILLSSFSLT
jgi:hypothetical protein